MALNADFTTGNLNGFTFTRADEQTVVDFEGVLKTIPTTVQGVQGARVVTNLLPDPTNASLWSGLGTTPPTIGGATTYLGESVLQTITFDDSMSAGYGGSRASTTGASGDFAIVAGRDYIYSAEIALSRNLVAGESIRFYATGSDGGGSPVNIDEDYDLAVWSRISTPVQTTTLSGSNFLVFFVTETINSGNAPVTIYVREPQAEDVTGQTNQNPSSFVDGTAYYAYENGNTVASDVVTEAQGTAITGIEGILLEDERTNYVTDSEDFTAASWSLTGSTAITADQAASPAGASNADLIDLSLGGDAAIFDIVGGSVGVDNSFSVYLRSVTGSGTWGINWYDGSHHRELTNVSTAWARRGIDFTLGTTTLYVYPGENRGGLGPTIDQAYAWGAQVELAGFPSSYIPTSGATATRATTSMARALVVPANTFTVTIVATMQFDHDDVKAGADVPLVLLDDGTTDNVFQLSIDATTDQFIASKTVSAGTTSTATTLDVLNYAAGTELTIAMASNEYGIHVRVNGGLWVTSNADDSALDWSTLLDRIEIMPAFVAVKSLTLTDDSTGTSTGITSGINGSIVG